MILAAARRLAARRRRRSASSCCSPPARSRRCAGAKAFDRGRLRVRVRLRLRPRLADRRADRDRVADLLPARGRLPRPGRPRRHPARGRPQRDRRRRAGRSRRCEIGRLDDADHRQRRPDRGRHRRQRGGRALPGRARGAQPRRRRARARWSARWSTRSPRPPATPSATWRPPSSSLFRGYRLARTAPAVEAAAEALEALGIEPDYINTGGGSDANALIAAGLPVLNVANGTERNHQPDESVTVEALETMLDVTLGDRRARARATMTFERIGSETVWEGKIATVRVDRFRYDDGEEAEREIVAHPGAVAVVAHDGERIFLVRQPREAGRTSRRCSSCPPASSTRRARARSTTAKRELAEEIGKGARELAPPDELLHLARLRRRGVPPVPGHRPLRRERRGRRGRADRDRRGRRWPSWTPSIERVPATRRRWSGCSGSAPSAR